MNLIFVQGFLICILTGMRSSASNVLMPRLEQQRLLLHRQQVERPSTLIARAASMTVQVDVGHRLELIRLGVEAETRMQSDRANTARSGRQIASDDARRLGLYPSTINPTILPSACMSSTCTSTCISVQVFHCPQWRPARLGRSFAGAVRPLLCRLASGRPRAFPFPRTRPAGHSGDARAPRNRVSSRPREIGSDRRLSAPCLQSLH